MDSYKLYAVKTWGSAMVELVLEHTGLPHEIEYLKAEDVRTPEYRRLNPVAQIPTLRLPGGEVMTESLAICTYLDAVGNGGLVPKTGDGDLARYLRWSTFLNTNIYGIASFADHPDWYVKDPGAQKELREVVTRRTADRFLLVEEQCQFPHFLGERLTLIDLIMTVMSFWEPYPNFFRDQCPKLFAAISTYKQTPQFRAVFARNDPANAKQTQS